jgi:glycosyltransferase involved in cell wall biosynthesis
MSAKPIISVIIPCFNTAKFIDVCLQCFLNQTVKPLEIIVVDDGSADNPEVIVAKYPQVTLLRHGKNKGYNAAKNSGIAKARGEFIYIADSDAVYEPDCLEKLLSPLLNDKKLDFSYCDFCFKNVMGGVDKVIRAKEFNPKKLREANFISSCSLVRASKILPADEAIGRLADWDYWLTMIEKGRRGKRVPEVLFNAFLRNDGISGRGNYDREYWRLRIQEKHKLAPRVAVYTFTRDRLEYTKRTFAGLKKFGYPFDHYILDNASTDGTVNWLRTYKKNVKNTHLFKSKVNLGISKSKNFLLGKIGNKYDYIMKLDNDCEIVSQDILRELIIISRALKDSAALSPNVEGLNKPVKRLAFMKSGSHILAPVPIIGGIANFSPRRFYQGFKSNPDYMISKGDVQFANHVWKSKGKMYYVEDLVVRHMDTTQGQIFRYPSYFDRRNQELDQQVARESKKPTDLTILNNNAPYWQEVYRVSHNWRFGLLYLVSRAGLYPLFAKVVNLVLNIKRKIWIKL